MVEVPVTMVAVRLHGPGTDGLRCERIATPSLRPGEALVEVQAAAITRDELQWPLERLPAVPSYELSGVVAVAGDVGGVMVGDPVYALAPFDRDGVAAEYAAVPAAVLAPKPSTLSHIESAAVPLAALSAWQGLFGHGGLQAGERVLVGGAVGGVGRFATQLARWRGAQVVATVSPSAFAAGRWLGAQEVLDGHGGLEGVGPVDLVFDTVGASSSGGGRGCWRGGSAGLGGRGAVAGGGDLLCGGAEPGQLVELAGLLDRGELGVAIDSTFGLSEATAAFARSLASGKHGKVVFRVAGQGRSRHGTRPAGARSGLRLAAGAPPGGHVHDLALGRDWHPRVPLGDGPATGQRAVAAHRPRICASRADQQGRRGVPAPSVLPSSTR